MLIVNNNNATSSDKAKKMLTLGKVNKKELNILML